MALAADVCDTRSHGGFYLSEMNERRRNEYKVSSNRHLKNMTFKKKCLKTATFAADLSAG